MWGGGEPHGPWDDQEGKGELGRLQAQGWLPSTCPTILCVLLITLRWRRVFLANVFPDESSPDIL